MDTKKKYEFKLISINESNEKDYHDIYIEFIVDDGSFLESYVFLYFFFLNEDSSLWNIFTVGETSEGSVIKKKIPYEVKKIIKSYSLYSSSVAETITVYGLNSGQWTTETLRGIELRYRGFEKNKAIVNLTKTLHFTEEEVTAFLEQLKNQKN